MPTIEEIDAQRSQWGEVWRVASMKIVLATLLAIAQAAREQGGVLVRLEWSDQGDWLSIVEVLGPENDSDFDEDEAHDYVWDAADPGDLRGEWQNTWGAYLRSDPTNEHFELEVAEILRDITLDKIGAVT